MAALMLLTIFHHLQQSLDAGMESYIFQLDFSAAFDRVSHSGLLFKLNQLVHVAPCCPFVQSSSPTVGRASWLMGAASECIPIISGMPQEACWVLFCLYTIPAKCLSWLRTDYLPIQMTPHYWQLFTIQHTDLLLLSRLTETWQGFRCGAITGA